MNRVLLVYKTGETIPFLIIRCDDFKSNEYGFFIERNNNKWFIPADWDYFVDRMENEEKIFNLLNNFQNEVKKL